MNKFAEIKFLIERKKTKIALERLKEIHSNQVDNDDIYFLYCCCYKQLGDFSSARVAIEKACELNPNSSRNLVEYASVEIVFRNDDKALNLLKSAIQNNPLHENAFTLKSIILLEKGDIKEAFESAGKAVSINPSNEIANNVLTINMFLHKQYSQADERITYLLNKNPQNSFTLTNLALSHYYKNEVEKSIEVAKNALRLSPNNVLIKTVLKIVIASKNKLAKWIWKFRLITYRKRGVIMGIFFIFYFIASFSIFFLLFVPDSKAIEIALVILLSVYVLFLTPLHAGYELGHLPLMNTPLGKLLLTKDEIISSLTTVILLVLGIGFVMKFLISAQPPSEFSDLQIGLFLMFLSNLPFSSRIIPSKKGQIFFVFVSLILISAFVLFQITPKPEYKIYFFVLSYFSISGLSIIGSNKSKQ